jgi:dolichyl-phosphate beta-glucosyltransferase
VYSLIVPNYNPGAGPGSGLEKTWHALCEFISRQTTSWEVLFVCDGSTDGSIEQLTQWCKDHRVGWCRILSYTPNQGKGLAVRVGLQQARGKIRVFTDVDLAYSFEDLLQVVETVKRGSPVAIASREHPDSYALLPMSMVHHVSRRRVQSHVFRSLSRQMIHLKYVDTQAGLKAFTAEAAEKLVPYLSCKGFGFDCEVLLACERLELPVTEVPVTVRYQTAASTTSWKSSFQMLKQIWQISQRWKHGIPAISKVPVVVHETGWVAEARPAARAA